MDQLMDKFILRNNVKIPCIGYGTWQTPNGETAVESIKQAIRIGYRHIDAAACYDNEVSVGKGIQESGIERIYLLQVRCGIRNVDIRKRCWHLKKRLGIFRLIIWIYT